MKQLFALTFVAALALASCQSAPKADEAKTEDQKVAGEASGTPYKVDSTQVVGFVGTKPVGQHSGTFNISDGAIFVQNDSAVTGGSFTINLSSLTVTDKDTSGSSKLKGHLLSADFFAVDSFPTAKFEITSVVPYTADSTNSLVLEGATHTITGNLTLKGTTKSVSFPAILSFTPTSVSAKANFNINRADWGMSYGNDQSLGDKFIRPEVNIHFDITANK
ncbi:MAG: YceI family protein [Niabella sp.]